MIKHCCPQFIKKRAGKIINISSVAGIMGNAGQANYSASKAGVIGLTKSTARELAGRNICCNAIAPGFIETEMTEEFAGREEVLKMIPLGRMGRAEEVAELTAFLASDKADYITGEVIRLDGGMAI
jgi:3-oxoacyl-[acyl-carrier protein] reductase